MALRCAAVLLLLAGLAGCGSSPSPAPSPGPTPVPAPAPPPPTAESCPAAPALSQLAADNARAEALFRAQALRPAQALPAAAPPGWVAAGDLGARGDGVSDDTAALQAALDRGQRVWLAGASVYRITRRLVLDSGSALGGDGRPTLWMAASGFDNTQPRRDDDGIYAERGVALRVQGEGALVQGLFLVNEWADDRYVIGIDVRAARRARLVGLRLRGFALAPGIVTIRSSEDVELRDTLIHAACSASVRLPADLGSFQITGVSVDDSRVDGRGSVRLVLFNNVIRDLRLVPNTVRGDQSDGIHFAGVGTARGSRVEANRVAAVDEGIDIFGAGIVLQGNQVQGRSLAMKLIHGAREIEIADNGLLAGRLAAIGMYRANPPVPERQVRDVLVRQNTLELGPGQAFEIDSGPGQPEAVVLRANREFVADCAQPRRSCPQAQCQEVDLERFVLGPGTRCPGRPAPV